MNTKTGQIIESLIFGLVIISVVFWTIDVKLNSLKSISVFIGLILFSAILDYYVWKTVFKKFIDWLKVRND